MSHTPIVNAEAVTPARWRTLRLFALYRMALAGLLMFSAASPGQWVEAGFQGSAAAAFLTLAQVYLLICLVGWGVAAFWVKYFSAQVSAMVLVDIAGLLGLMVLAGGLGSGIGVLLLVSLAGAALVGEGRLVLLYAAMATLSLLGIQMFVAWQAGYDGSSFVQAGALSLAFFAVALSGRVLARRIIASEALARQRGDDLRRQLGLTSQVISLLDDGILVVNPRGEVVESNPRGVRLCGLEEGVEGRLEKLSSALASAFAAWRATGAPNVIEFKRGTFTLRARFLALEGGPDALLVLQDVGEQRAAEQRLKLAALGRLTGGIAHEIRNPLSSVRHAAELLREDKQDPASARLLAIITDNARRIERIVSDVLELGRRDGARSQDILLSDFVRSVLAEFSAQTDLMGHTVAVEVSGALNIRFDPLHLRQVLWNLLRNAVRYASDQRGGVRVVARNEPFELAVLDDGPGVPSEQEGKLFEPFQSTDPKGNGLGLYIARELCEANGYVLSYRTLDDGGACFAIRREKEWSS